MFAGRAPLRPRWRRARRDDAGSMPIAVLITLVGMTLSASLTSLVVGQLRDSRRAADRTASVATAEAGLDAGLATLRAAVNGTAGDVTKLPCTTITGTLTTLAGTSTATPPAYSVSIGYFLTDPSTMIGTLAPIGDLTNITALSAGTTTLAALLASLGQTVANTAPLTAALTNAVGCTGAPLKVSRVPVYALLRSTGTVSGTTRTLYGIYPFRTTGVAAPGGHIVISNTSYCLGGGNATPVAGNPVLAVLCTSNDTRVKFNYQKNLSLLLTLSPGTTYPNGLCITVANRNDGTPALFQPCVSPSSTTQQWSYDVTTQTFWAGTSNSGACLSRANDDTIVLSTANSCGTNGQANKAMVPEVAVGAGGNAKSGQYVSLGAVGRCLDAGANPGPGTTLVLSTCQTTVSITSSQSWTGPTIPSGAYMTNVGTIFTSPASGNGPFCLKSQNGGSVKLSPCNSSGTQEWTVYDASPVTAESYRITDGSDKCLQAAPGTGSNANPSTWTDVITATCNGSDSQKWNVPSSSSTNPLTNILER